MLNNLASFSDAIMSTRMDAGWSYDRNAGRYRDEKGRFLSKASVEKLVDTRIEKLETTLKRITRMLSEGSITLDQWQSSVRELIKAAHIQAAIVGYGGRQNMGSAEFGRIGQKLRQEYQYLQGFARDMLEQRLSAPMALARIGLYARSVRSSYWEGTGIRQQEQGYSLMKRVLDPQSQHCQDCIGYASLGIVPMGAVPMPGIRCACMASCRCSVLFFRQQAPVVPV